MKKIFVIVAAAALSVAFAEEEYISPVTGKPVPKDAGLLADGTETTKGMKAGDVDPRGDPAYCLTASDKALAVGGGVLEAILHFSGALAG